MRNSLRQKIKRLIAINPARNSYAIIDNASPRGTTGRSVGFFASGMLNIDADVEGGDRLIETLALDTTGNALTVTVKLRRSDVGRPLEFKRVYVRGE